MRKIRLCYRKVIDAHSVKAWDRAVFDATHLEFYMQAQRVDLEGKHQTFMELEKHLEGAAHLHYLTSTAAAGYIQQLNGVVPDVTNAHGKPCLPFSDFKFEIIQSHIVDKAMHTIVILFYSDYVSWIDTVGSQILVSYGTQADPIGTQMEVEVDLIPMVANLSMSHFTMS